MLNSWSPSRRKKSTDLYKDKRPTDPDEDTIWNVLCPQIQSTWSEYEERMRRVTRTPPIIVPEAASTIFLEI
jgi:hypothetical protein